MAEFDFSMLNENVCNVTFTKKNGEERTMKCTKNFSFVPEDKIPSGNGRKKTDGLQIVFDVEKNDWRSFYEENVTEFAVCANF